MKLRFEVRFSNKGWKKLRRLSKIDARRVIKKVVGLESYPSVVGDIKKMSGGKLKLCRLRIGDIRVIFEVDNVSRVVWVIEVGYRGQLYKNK